MNTRKTFALVAVFCLLCAGYYGVHWYETHRTEEEAAAKRLFSFESDELASLQLERSDGTTIEAVHTDGAWDIVAPYDHIAPNRNVWQRVSNAWTGLSNERTFGERDLATYGLDDPVLTITGTPEDGEATTVIFGSTEPLQVGRYAYTEDVGVFLVQESAFRELDRPLQDLRERHLIAVGEQGVTQLAFAFLREAEQGGAPLEPGLKPIEESTTMLVEKSEGAWALRQPVDFPADQQAVDALAQGLQFATATAFVDTPESYEDYGLDPPRARVTVWSEAVDGPQELFLGDADRSSTGAIWAKRKGNPSVFQIGGEILSLLPTEPEAFRERRLLTRDLEALQELELVYKGGTIRLANDPEGGWQMVEPFAEDTDQTQVSSYLAVLKNAKGTSFPEITAGEAGLVAPEYTIRLHYPDEIREIRIGGHAAVEPLPVYYVQLDFGAISVFTEILRNALVREPFDFRDKHLMKFEPGSAQRVQLHLDDREFLLEKQLGRWQAVSPAGAVIESQSDVDALLVAMSDAEAVGVEVPAAEVANADLAALGLDAPVFTVEVDVVDEGGDTHAVGPLSIGGVSDDASQERYVVSEGRPEIFRAKQALLDAIRDALRGIRVPAAPEG